MNRVASPPRADVVVGGDDDRLLVIARDPERVREVRQLVRQAGVPVRATAGGAMIPASAAGAFVAIADSLPLSWDTTSRQFAENRRALRRRHEAMGSMVCSVVDAGPAAAHAVLAGLPHAEQ